MATIKDECPKCKKLGLGKPTPVPLANKNFSIKREMRKYKYCGAAARILATQSAKATP